MGNREEKPETVRDPTERTMAEILELHFVKEPWMTLANVCEDDLERFFGDLTDNSLSSGCIGIPLSSLDWTSPHEQGF